MFERFGQHARTAVVLAQEEARELGAKRIGPEHLLISLVGNADPGLAAVLSARGITAAQLRTGVAERAQADPLGVDDAEALRSVGIDLAAVQASVAENFGADAWDNAEPEPKRGVFGKLLGGNWGHIPFTTAAKKSLELSLREAIHRKDREIRSAHLLLGVLRADEAGSAALLGGRDAVAALRADIDGMLDRAA
ncbi:Clp protease N-terminal domain-containing protein [Nocardia asteroides]|uniref:Clp protease N-terminal domain-containing protein n=1 Tax=Nocardia asteroides TaxID=1824 RepID=UPI001E38FEBC|nr:Clp protease N-terminal domain-containing protein [Nocardia asteroides]UGT57996.1 Clp protease [Nocardia asteroides]